LWARSGSELFYVDADRRLIAARVETDSEFRVLERLPLFTLGPEYRIATSGNADFYDISLDDQQFLMGRSASAESIGGSSRVVVVQNFFEELRQRMGN
jgi:hypothetical protein